jgi:thioesterase domain-containing protein
MSLSQVNAQGERAARPGTALGVASESWPHLIVLNKGGSRPPLVLISGQEGHAFGFRHLTKLLGEDQPLYALQLIGIDRDEPPDCSIEETAAVFEVEVHAACPHGPIILGGYSMGGAIAFELARRLQEHGRQVPLIVSIDGFAPRYHRTLIPAHVHFLRQMRIALGHARTERLKALRRHVLHLLPKSSRGTGVRKDDDPRTIMLAVLRYRTVMQYKPTCSLRLALLLVRASRPEEFLAPHIDDPLYGWERFIDGPIEASTVEGEHLTFLESDAANREIAALVRKHIDAVCSSKLGSLAGVDAASDTRGSASGA